MAPTFRSIATRTGPRLMPDPQRVALRLFLPGDDVPGYPSRTDEVVRRVLAFDDGTVTSMLGDVIERYGSRHPDLAADFADHFDAISARFDDKTEISEERRQLIGACLTDEYSVEGASLTNPSIVTAPDQSGLEPGELRFVMSVRCIGEPHASTIGFRTGVIGSDGKIRVDEPAPRVRRGHTTRIPFPRNSLVHEPTPAEDPEVVAYLLGTLPEMVTDRDLDHAIAEVPHRLAVRRHGPEALTQIRTLTLSCYGVEFPPGLRLDEKILWPAGPAERRGMEDARFVRFTSDEGDVEYQATYTAFDGFDAVSHLVTTKDFEDFRVVRLAGIAAGVKGLALFPRTINGLRHALCRPDMESLSVATSPDGILWDGSKKIREPDLAWETVQSGNCGSPIETEAGWLLVTHGVGPMREYRLGAVLLDLEDPSVVRAELPDPLLVPDPEERDGYVPNVVYSCGSLVHDGTLVIPYGFTDRGVDFATVGVEDLLDRMTWTDGSRTRRG